MQPQTQSHHQKGTWRTHLNTEEKNLISVAAPEGVSNEYLACLAVNPASAYRMLEDFVNLKEGKLQCLSETRI